MKHGGSIHKFTHKIVVDFEAWIYAHRRVATFYKSSND